MRTESECSAFPVGLSTPDSARRAQTVLHVSVSVAIQKLSVQTDFLRLGGGTDDKHATPEQRETHKLGSGVLAVQNLEGLLVGELGVRFRDRGVNPAIDYAQNKQHLGFFVLNVSGEEDKRG